MGYLTYLDVFVFSAFSIMAAVTVQNVTVSVLNRHYGSDVVHSFNKITAITISAVWGMCHLLLPISLFRARIENAAALEATKVKDEANNRRWRLSADVDTEEEEQAAGRPVSHGFATPGKATGAEAPAGAPAAPTAVQLKVVG